MVLVRVFVSAMDRPEVSEAVSPLTTVAVSATLMLDVSVDEMNAL